MKFWIKIKTALEMSQIEIYCSLAKPNFLRTIQVRQLKLIHCVQLPTSKIIVGYKDRDVRYKRN